MYQKSVKFIIIGTLKIVFLNMNHIFAMVVMVSCKELLVSMMLLFFYVKEGAYRIQFWYLSKDDEINITNNASLIDKIGIL